MYGEIFREIRDFRVTISNAEGLSFFTEIRRRRSEVYEKNNLFLCLSV